MYLYRISVSNLDIRREPEAAQDGGRSSLGRRRADLPQTPVDIRQLRLVRGHAGSVVVVVAILGGFRAAAGGRFFSLLLRAGGRRQENRKETTKTRRRLRNGSMSQRRIFANGKPAPPLPAGT